MNSLKYIFLIALIGMLSSCAKDDNIPMLSLKIDAKVSNITATDVLIEFSIPDDNEVIRLDELLLYDENGQPVSINEYGEPNMISISDAKFCVIKNLKPNTAYKYELVIREFNNDYNYSINNTSSGGYKWRGILLSDSSFTFKTQAPSVGDNPLQASVKIESLTKTSAVLQVTLDYDLEVVGSYYDIIYISESEIGSNPVYGRYDFNSLNKHVITYYFDDLKQDTKYYVFTNGSFRYTKMVNGHEFEYTLENVSLQIDNNSFKTPNESEYTQDYIQKIKEECRLKEIFNSESYYIGYLQFNSETLVDLGSILYLSEEGGCTNPIALGSIDSYFGGELCIYSYNLKPATKYFVTLAFRQIDSTEPMYIKIVDIASFITRESGDFSLSTDITASVLSENGYSLRFDFDRHLLLHNPHIQIGNALWCSDFKSDNGYVSGKLNGVESNIFGEYSITSFDSDVYYKTDEGYVCQFPFPLYYNPIFKISENSQTQGNITEGKVPVLNHYTIEDKPVIGYGFYSKYLY